MEEEWRDIKGYEGLYQVSNEGRVKSLERDAICGRGGVYHFPERLLKPTANSVGYLQVYLCKDGKPKWYRVHRLVAQVFLPNPDNLPEVNHKDENQHNNRLENLEWCTHKENCNYGRRKVANQDKTKKVAKYDLDGNLLAVYKSLSEAWRTHNVPKGGGIGNCCRGEQKQAYGYKWQYVS